MTELNLNEKNDLVNLRKLLIEYSTNVKNYAKWFEITEINKNESTYTSYKVVYRFLPKDLNESIKELTVWKRFRDFKDLYQIMSDHHISLHRKDKFPEFTKSKFWNRFEEKVIEERKDSSLKLLQFIGSQSHLYRHEKFLEFFEEAKFVDYININNKAITLKPNVVHNSNSEPKTRKKSLEKTKYNSLLEHIQCINGQISNLVELDSELNSNKVNSFILEYLSKTKKLISLSITNQSSKCYYASYNLLKSAASTLIDCISEVEMRLTSSQKSKILKQTNLIKEIINDLNINAQQICETNLGKLSEKLDKNENFIKSNNQTNVIQNEVLEDYPKASETNTLNDWILSDFNLLSNDFNNELTFISGNMFDLNFTYRLSRILNNNCFLMKLRHPMKKIDQSLSESDCTGNVDSSEEFLIKRLHKSSNPNLVRKSIVPYGSSKIPYMCRLIKYYESDFTIFLLIEYEQYGKLYNYLHFLMENGENFLNNLSKYKHYKKNNSIDRPSKYSPKYHRKSFSQGSMSFKIDPKQFFKRTQSVREESKDLVYLDDPTDFQKLQQISGKEFQDFSTNSLDLPLNEDEIKYNLRSGSNEKVVKISNLEKSSSNSSNEKDENDFKTKRWSFSILKKLSNKMSSKHQIVTFKNDESLDNHIHQTNKKITNEIDPYRAQIKLWLAQLMCALKALHKFGIIWKDLHSDNLLLSKSGNLILTYMSKWSLVDENLSDEAIKNFYVAPEHSGLVNYNSENEACDWWSFGVILYEMITMKKFSSLNTIFEIYTDNVNFPIDFSDDVAKDLIQKILKKTPSERLECEKIQTHSFFSTVNWNSLEKAFFSNI